MNTEEAIQRFDFFSIDCQAKSIFGGGNIKWYVQDYRDISQASNYCFGTVNAILMILVALYVAAVCYRKHRLTKYEWSNIAFLFTIYFLDIFIYFDYFHVDIGEFRNCHIWDKILAGTIDALLYNISLLMAYKLFTISNNFYEFAINGTLP